MSDCDVTQRTRQLGVVVEAPDIAIVVCYARAQSDLNAPPPYISTTGVIMTGQNLPPGKPAIVDPCQVVGEPIVATVGDVAVKVRYPDGHEQDFQQATPHAPAGKYYVNIVWGIQPTGVALRTDGSTGRSVELRLHATEENLAAAARGGA
jgi:hypothetical protein